MTIRSVENFGGNIRFQPRHVYHPTSEFELLEILQLHQAGSIRVAGSRHSWSPVVETDDALVVMSAFDFVHFSETDGQLSVIVGAGCQVKTLLRRLNERGLTTPSVGLVTEQTIAGAIATGTHGSGKHSLSHYIEGVRLACYDETGTVPKIVDITGGPELQAARCSLGCLGIVVSVTLPCLPQYYVEERMAPARSLEAVLAQEQSTPLQQFFLMPHAWTWWIQQRRLAPVSRRAGWAALYRIYWLLTIDIGLHLMVKLLASWLQSPARIQGFYRRVIPWTLFTNWTVSDRSDRQLVMEHELFRHLELEVFVTRSQLAAATAFAREVMELADERDHAWSETFQQQLQDAGLTESARDLAGRFTHHYPIAFRRILPDDTLISMSSGTTEDWYSLSFITYVEPRDNFYRMATLLARGMHQLFNARIHWGKWFPFTAEEVSGCYPRLEEFRQIARRHDPRGVFRNEFVKGKLGLE